MVSPYRLVSPYTRQRIGRRGAFLLILSFLQALLGWTTLGTPPLTVQNLTVFRDIPLWVLACTWLIPAVVSFFASWSRPGGLDGPAFFLGYGFFFLWGAAYVASWWPLGDLAAGGAWRPAGFYLCIAGLILVTSGWPEVSQIRLAQRKASGDE